MIQKSNTWRVLKMFLDDPLRRFLVRELGRALKLAPPSVKAHLVALEKEGLVHRTPGLYPQYVANFEDGRFRFYKKINALISIQESGLVDYLGQRFSPDAIILFGSAAKGEDLAQSDIDLFVQAGPAETKLEEYEKKLKRRIQLFIYPHLSKVPVELRNNIINGVKLAGYVPVWTSSK